MKILHFFCIKSHFTSKPCNPCEEVDKTPLFMNKVGQYSIGLEYESNFSYEKKLLFCRLIKLKKSTYYYFGGLQ
jgi:hypothetical protein